MLEEQKASNAACTAFEQHRFKHHLCVHCFKPKAAHAETEQQQTRESAKIIALDNNVNKVQEHAGKAEYQRYDVPKVIIRNQNNLQKDAGRGRGERQTERNNRKRGKERTKDSAPHNAKREAASKPSRNAMTLNIPLESGSSQVLNNAASAKGESTNTGMNIPDSCLKNGSTNVAVLTDKQGTEAHGNPLPSAATGDSDIELSGSFSEQFRGVLRPVLKSGSPTKLRDGSDSEPDELPEFVKVAKNLRRITGMGISPSVEVHSNNNHSVAIEAELLPDLPDLPNVIGADASVEEQQKLVEAKSNLPMSVVLKSQSSVTGHETLPKNMGKSRPSIQPLANHRRQTSDPEVFMPTVKEDMVVNVSREVQESNNSELTTENVVVRNSQLSSDVYFGKSPVTSPQKRVDHNEDLLPRYGHIADCVTIIAQNGEVSHHFNQGRSKSEEEGNNSSSQIAVTSTDPYRVVDVNESHSQQKKSRTSSAAESSASTPSSSSAGRMSQELDEGVGLGHQEDAASRFPRRNVALVDGIYSASQFHTDSGINDSMESSDSSDGPKQEASSNESAKRTTPTYPIILHEEQTSDHRKKKRNSGQYKVPIFIMPKAFNTTDWSNTKHSDIEGTSSGSTSADQGVDYLQPKEKVTEMETTTSSLEESVKEENVREEDKNNLLDSKKVSLSNESLRESRRPSRSRSRTHPVMEESLSNTSSSKDHEQPEFRARLKRIAPRPPSMEFAEHVYGRERDDRLDSLPHRSPPPPPQGRKDSKQSLDRSSSDLSDENERLSHPSVHTDISKTRAETRITGSGSSGQKPEAEREMSPSRLRDISPERHRELSPLRDHHESRKVISAKKENHFRARLREFSPTGRRELSPSGRGKHREPPTKDPQLTRRVASPPPPLNRPSPLNLPNTTSTQDAPAITTKSKRSKLPWKRKKKRSDSGSPEREFNSEEVEKWLVNSFSASSLAPADTNPRNSLERLEVINAYKGERTVTITRPLQASNNAASPPCSAPPTTSATPTTSTTTTPNNTPSKRTSFTEADDEDLLRNATSNVSKRRAPNPPTPAPADADDLSPVDTSSPVQLKKAYSLSPTSRRKNYDEEDVDGATAGEHLYENLGAHRVTLAPQKPARRRQRNRTTGFEDMPSRIKRMAPKTPDKPATQQDQPDGEDELDGVVPIDARAYQLLFSSTTVSSSPPLKSALRSTVSEPAKVDADGNVIPRRPVRILAPEDEAINTEPSHPTVLRSNYKNLALVPQVDLDSSSTPNHNSKEVETQADLPSLRKLPVISTETQCDLASLDRSSLERTEQQSLLRDVSAVHLQALTQLSQTTASPRSAVDWTSAEGEAVWSDQVSAQSEPRCQSAGAAFFDITHPTNSSAKGALMVCCDSNKASQVLQMAELTKSMLRHPNLLSVSLASKAPISLDPTLLEQKRSRGSPPSPVGSIDTALILTDSPPLINVAEYVSRNAEKHEYLPEVYERDVGVMLLQLCQGLCQLQARSMCLESLKLDHLLLTDSGLPGGGQRLVINHLMGAELVNHPAAEASSSSEVASKLDQKCHEFDVGILVYEFLHQPNPFSTRTSLIISDYTEDDLPSIPTRSPLTEGLRSIAAKLLAKNPQDRLTCSQAIVLLQCLLWGPSPALYASHVGAMPETLNQELERWKATQQANMVTKVALYALLNQHQSPSAERAGFGLVDQLQSQFLTDVSLEACRRALDTLYQKSQGDPISVIDSDLDL